MFSPDLRNFLGFERTPSCSRPSRSRGDSLESLLIVRGNEKKRKAQAYLSHWYSLYSLGTSESHNGYTISNRARTDISLRVEKQTQRFMNRGQISGEIPMFSNSQEPLLLLDFLFLPIHTSWIFPPMFPCRNWASRKAQASPRGSWSRCWSCLRFGAVIGWWLSCAEIWSYFKHIYWIFPSG